MIGEFKKAAQDFIVAVEKFPEDKREEILFDKWSLKDIIGHLSAWQIISTDVIDSLNKNLEAPRWGDVDVFNDAETAKRAEESFETVFKEFQETLGQYLDAYQNLSDELKNKRIWEDSQLTVEKFFSVMINEYKEHLKEVEKYL